MESPKLGHGFMSYALAMWNGGRMADRRPADGVIGLTELLEFAAARVPLLARNQGAEGRPIWVGDGDKAFMPAWGTYGPQQPSLFNLTRDARDFIVEVKSARFGDHGPMWCNGLHEDAGLQFPAGPFLDGVVGESIRTLFSPRPS